MTQYWRPHQDLVELGDDSPLKAWTITTSPWAQNALAYSISQLQIPQEQVRAHIQDHRRVGISVLKQMETLNLYQRARIQAHNSHEGAELISVGLLSRQHMTCVLGELEISVPLWITRGPLSPDEALVQPEPRRRFSKRADRSRPPRHFTGPVADIPILAPGVRKSGSLSAARFARVSFWNDDATVRDDGPRRRRARSADGALGPGRIATKTPSSDSPEHRPVEDLCLDREMQRRAQQAVEEARQRGRREAIQELQALRVTRPQQSGITSADEGLSAAVTKARRSDRRRWRRWRLSTLPRKTARADATPPETKAHTDWADEGDLILEERIEPPEPVVQGIEAGPLIASGASSPGSSVAKAESEGSDLVDDLIAKWTTAGND